MKKKILAFVLVTSVIWSIAGCNQQQTGNDNTTETSNETEVVEGAQMQYIDKESLKYAITSIQEEYVLLDVRKQEDYDTDHIINAVSADLDAAKDGDNESGEQNLKAALKKATGKETGKDDTKFILLCYSGASYAQKGTDLLINMGVDSDNIYTLEGGYKGWTEEDPYGHYQFLIDAVEVSAEKDKANEFTSKLFLPVREGDYYFEPEEVKKLYENEETGSSDDKISDYYIMDARYESEYENGHLIGSVLSSTFGAAEGAVWVTRDEVIKNIETAFETSPYTDGQKIIIVCRGGRGGAQLLDDVLVEEYDIDNDLVYTLSYGYGAFDESWAKQGDDYMKYVVSGAEPGSIQ